jgi:hypothetical protein
MTTPANTCSAANRRYAIDFVSHWFYNLISFGGRALLHPPQYGYGGRAAEAAELGLGD